FKEIADRLYSTYIHNGKPKQAQVNKDSIPLQYTTYKEDLYQLSKAFQLNYKDSTGRADEWGVISGTKKSLVLQKKPVMNNTMPILKGMGLKDAVYLCENIGLTVSVKGRGRVN
ncbi:hypothetical protein, partial [Enterococcus faecium]|uniref:hypothetical protein n=1 Tax=Enterococcus faecium TaxID=1352 RepID=UPI0034E965FD